MNSSIWTFVPLILVILIGCLFWYKLRKSLKNESPGPQGQRPYGINGWLALYIGASYYLAPLVSMGSLSNALTSVESANPMVTSLDGWSTYKAGSWVLLCVAIIWQWRSAWLLKNRWEPSSVRFTKTFLLINPLVLSIGDATLGAVALDVVDGASVGQSLARGMASGLIWAAYFQFSKRVKNTYFPIATKVQSTDTILV